MDDDTTTDAAALRALIGSEALAELRRLYGDDARHALEVLRAGTAPADEAVRLVHDLKSGSFLLDLTAAARAAAAVEAALIRQDPAAAELLPDLYAAVEAALGRLQPSG